MWAGHAGEQLRIASYTGSISAAPYIRGKVLDFGCGTGLWREVLRLSGASEYIGVDTNDRMIDGARSRWGDDGTFANIVFDDPLPFADGEFDTVFSCAVLQHNRNEYKPHIFREFRRVLKAGGHYVMTENRVELGGEDGYSFTVDHWKDLIEGFGFKTIFIDGMWMVFEAI